MAATADLLYSPDAPASVPRVASPDPGVVDQRLLDLRTRLGSGRA
jgi:hypothetical protein